MRFRNESIFTEIFLNRSQGKRRGKYTFRPNAGLERHHRRQSYHSKVLLTHKIVLVVVHVGYF
jgi:hypothetical protein